MILFPLKRSMEFVDKYLQNKRKRELKKINEALANLKKNHPFEPSAFKPKEQVNPQSQHMHQNNNKRLAIILLLLVGLLVLGWTAFTYRSDLSDLQEDYDTTVERLYLLESRVKNTTSLLEETRDTLKNKEEKALNLSDESVRLKSEMGILEKQIADLNKEIVTKEAEILNLNKTIVHQKREITLWKICIKDEFDEDPKDCDNI